jgi:hypothetical protein
MTSIKNETEIMKLSSANPNPYSENSRFLFYGGALLNDGEHVAADIPLYYIVHPRFPLHPSSTRFHYTKKLKRTRKPTVTGTTKKKPAPLPSPNNSSLRPTLQHQGVPQVIRRHPEPELFPKFAQQPLPRNFWFSHLPAQTHHTHPWSTTSSSSSSVPSNPPPAAFCPRYFSPASFRSQPPLPLPPLSLQAPVASPPPPVVLSDRDINPEDVYVASVVDVSPLKRRLEEITNAYIIENQRSIEDIVSEVMREQATPPSFTHHDDDMPLLKKRRF